MKPKNLLYLMKYQRNIGFNLRRKFDGQIQAFKKIGFQVTFLMYDEEGMYLNSDGTITKIKNIHSRFPEYTHTMFFYDLHRCAIQVCKEKSFDVLYWRAAPLWRSSGKLADFLKKQNIKVIYEIPTYNPNQKEMERSFLRKLFRCYSNFWEKKVYERVDVFIFTGDATFSHFHDKPAINVENAINAEETPLRVPIYKKNSIDLLALASMCYWHGYDRLIKSLSEYKGDENIIIHIVGGNDGGCLPEWINLARELGLENKVIFHGALYGKELNEIFNLCDVGINSLGMYRKGFNETSELKTRDYIARGLPFVSAVWDKIYEKIPNDYWMSVPNDESIPDMEEIVAFAKKVKSNTMAGKKLREIALTELSWEKQYQSVFHLIGMD